MKNTRIQKMVLSGLFIALGYILPYFTGQIPTIGSMLLPMHIPVLIAGFICGAPYGAAIGFLTPLLRSVVTGMPPLFPVAIAMAFELATYGYLTGFFYKLLKKNTFNIYLSLLFSMVGGRVVWGLVTFALLGIKGGTFGLLAFVEGAFLGAIPGIILQIILIPAVVVLLQKHSIIAKINVSRIQHES